MSAAGSFVVRVWQQLRSACCKATGSAEIGSRAIGGAQQRSTCAVDPIHCRICSPKQQHFATEVIGPKAITSEAIKLKSFAATRICCCTMLSY